MKEYWYDKKYENYRLKLLLRKKKKYISDLNIKDLNKYYNYLIKLQTSILKELE